MAETVTLKELKVGSRFILAKDLSKREPIYEVIGLVEFNSGHGSATRECKNTKTKKRESKSCRLNVIKLPIEPESPDERLIMVVVNPDDRIVLAGEPRKLTAQECRDYMQPGWSVSTMKFSEYKQLNKKWVFE